VWGMARSLCPDAARATVAVAAAILVLLAPGAWGQVGAIVAGGAIGWAGLRDGAPPQHSPLTISLPRGWPTAAGVLFLVLLCGLPIAAAAVPALDLRLFD